MDESLLSKLDTSYLVVSMLWSAVGGGFWIYGKKQRSAPPLYGGMALMAISWVITSALWMSLASVAIIAGIWWWSKQD